MTHPTRRQRDVLRAIVELRHESGITPSIRELCDRFGWGSIQAAHGHLRALRRRGLVEWSPGKSRTLRLTEAGVGQLAFGPPVMTIRDGADQQNHV